MTASAPASRRPRLVIFLIAVLLLLALGWSAVWFYAAHRAEQEIDAWVTREVKLGRIWNCAERRLAGFPFRFELVCGQPSLETRGGDPIRFTAVAAHAVAQVWAPNHIVAEFVGPARLEDRATGRAYGANWELFQLSGVGDLSGQPQRFSVVVQEPRVDDAAAADAGSLLAAHRLEFHARRQPTGASPDSVEYAVGLTKGRSALATAVLGADPVDVTVQGVVTAAADLRPMPLTQRLRAWAAAGGVAHLERLAITSPQLAASAKGALSLDMEGRLNGNLDLGFAGLTELVKQLDRSGLMPRDLSPIVGALAMVGKAGTVEGRKGVTYALAFKNGTLRFGGFPVGLVPPAF